MFKNKNIAILLVIFGLAILVLQGCDEKFPAEPETEDHFIAKIEIHPPAFARSESTQHLWDSEISFELPLNAEQDGGGHGHKISANNLILADTTINGMKIEVEVEDAEHMKMWMNGSWMESEPELEQNHFEITLEDPNLDAHASKIFNSDVTITIHKDGVDIATGDLHPMYGEHGFHYGGNYALPNSGDYEIIISASVPTFARGESTSTKWMQETIATFNYTYSGAPLTEEIEIGEMDINDMKVELEAEGPERMWVLMNDNWMWMEPDQNDTHHFEVKLEDPTVEAHQEVIGYCEIHVSFMNETTGEVSEEIELHSMYGEHGFHYGANVHIQAGDDQGGGGHGH